MIVVSITIQLRWEARIDQVKSELSPNELSHIIEGFSVLLPPLASMFAAHQLHQRSYLAFEVRHKRGTEI
jgi:hypothetical protein